MVEKFPYGKAPFWLLVIAIVATSLRVASAARHEDRADLVLVTFSGVHYETYKRSLPEFERKRGVRVQLQFANAVALQSRLQNSMLAGADVPDMAELIEGSLSFFTRGPKSDIGLLDLTDRIHDAGLDQKLVPSRLTLWSSDRRIYALPHDVHPVMLAYRRDLVEALGIDVRELDTWDKFVEAGRRITKDVDGDGTIDRYMMDLSYDGSWGIDGLLSQRGGQLFDADGRIAFNNDLTVEVIEWLLRQTFGPQRIAYDADASIQSGQSLIKAMTDGLVLFVWTPDWRSRVFEEQAPHLKGKMALMPLPAWAKGERRTTVWGGTGLVIARQSAHPDLAWDLANYLYFDPAQVGERFKGTGIIPVMKDAWSMPELDAPDPYYSNQPIGRLYTELAPSTPPKYLTAYTYITELKLYEAYTRSLEYYKQHGEDGLTQKVREELSRAEAYVRLRVERGEALAKASD
ncbi:MAG TPA: extracellular solute-binding protein [Polyangiaceae bacterium]